MAEYLREKAEAHEREHDPADPFEDKLPRSARAKMYSSFSVIENTTASHTISVSVLGSSTHSTWSNFEVARE